MANTKLLTTKYSSHLAHEMLESLTTVPNTAFYFYTGVHGAVIGDVPEPNDDNRTLIVDAYRNMIFGKRVTAADVALVARNIPYTGNTVFAMYDDNDEDMLTKDFFCSVDEGAYFHVYKCLDNNFGLPSTVQPAFTYVTEGSNYTFQTSDNYVWKYMYSISAAQNMKFTTQNYIPVFPNTAVTSASAAGAIDVIVIDQTNLTIPGGGRKYDNYTAGTFATNQLRVGGNNFLYAISNDTINYTTGFYTGCLIYISSGTGIGQRATVTNYFTNANGNFIVLDEIFTVNPTNGSTYQIYPKVTVKGSGTETVNAVARALINATGSNSIFKIEMLEKGLGYTYAIANIVANSVVTQDVNFVEATIRPINPPVDGHGHDAATELGCDAVEFTISFANSEGGILPIENRYQQIGLIRDPKFANVNIEIANAVGTFDIGEPISKYTLKRINSNVAISNTTTTILGEMLGLSSAAVVTSGTTGTYVPGDILTLDGGTYVVPGQVRVLTTKVRSATINAAGTGYTPGTFTANLNLGVPTTNATFTVTVNSIGQCNSVVIVNPGLYTSNPPFPANSTPVGGAGSGLRLNLGMGLNTVDVFNRGAYATVPANLIDNEPLSNTGNGVGAEIIIAFTPTLSADFANQLDEGDYIYITATDQSQQHLAVVNNITNATSLQITVNGYFTCSAAFMYEPTESTTATLSDIANSTNILLSGVTGELFTGDLLIGKTSSAKAQVNAIMQSGVTKTLSSFVQMYKYDVGVLSGEFEENEIVYQGNSLDFATATALLHSVVNGNIMYTSNQMGDFVNTDYIHGANSLSIASINNIYSPEVEFGSGRVLYIENMEPVERANNRTETLQVILTF